MLGNSLGPEEKKFHFNSISERETFLLCLQATQGKGIFNL